MITISTFSVAVDASVVAKIEQGAFYIMHTYVDWYLNTIICASVHPDSWLSNRIVLSNFYF